MKFISYSFLLVFLCSATTLSCNNSTLNLANDQSELDNAINQHIIYENLKEQLLVVQEDLEAIDTLYRGNIPQLKKKFEAKEIELLKQLKEIDKDFHQPLLTGWQKIIIIGGSLVITSSLILAIINNQESKVS